MTRENKLALVVGFALILVVGILVSDHFSVARAQETALVDQLNVKDPLLAQRQADPDLIRTGAAAPGPAVVGRSATPPAAGPASTVVDPARIATNGSANARAVNTAASHGNANATRDSEHVVRRNESLTHICRAFYGTETYVAALAEYNDLGDPDLVRAGQTIRLPDAAALIGGSGPTRAPAAPPAAPETYTVAEGDNLSKIASKTLGRHDRYLDLYAANRDQLESPDDIRPGMVLRIPS